MVNTRCVNRPNVFHLCCNTLPPSHPQSPALPTRAVIVCVGSVWTRMTLLLTYKEPASALFIEFVLLASLSIPSFGLPVVLLARALMHQPMFVHPNIASDSTSPWNKMHLLIRASLMNSSTSCSTITSTALRHLRAHSDHKALRGSKHSLERRNGGE
jgi:hypothetical protein